MTPAEWAEVVAVMRSAPLANMSVAERVAGLIAKVERLASDAAAQKDADGAQLPGCLNE